MKDLLKIISKRPGLYQQSKKNIWDDMYISKNILKAHLDQNLDSATRKIDFVKKSVDWISTVLPPANYPLLLDLGCGPGIYTERFYHKGYDVSGIDLSSRSITYAKRSACNNRLQIKYFQGDYTKINFCSHYNLITMIYCDFGVLPDTDRRELLIKIYDSLLPEGVFLFDVFTPLKYTGIEEVRDWEVVEEGFWSKEQSLSLHSFYRYDKDNTFLNQYIIATKSDISLYNIWEHTFTMEELKKDLKEAGFRKINAYGDAAGKQYGANSETLCILAQK